jgi:hypothetical protein
MCELSKVWSGEKTLHDLQVHARLSLTRAPAPSN